MDPEIKLDLTPEEAAAEQAEIAYAGKKEEEVRAEIIAEYGFDEVDDVEKINKLVTKEVDSRKKLFAAIGQKIKYREQAKKSATTIPPKDTSKPPADEDINKKLDERFAARDLEALEYSDDVKKEISDWSKFKGISIKQAASAPHIVKLIEDKRRAEEAEEAATSRKNNSPVSRKSWKADVPPDADMSTPEGRKTYDEWKQWAIKQTS